MLNCNYCNSKVPNNEISKDITGKNICPSCIMMADETAHTIKIIESTGIYNFSWSDRFHFKNRDTGEVIPGIPAVSGFVGNAAILEPGFKAVFSDWIMQINDFRYVNFVSFMRQMITRKIIPPFPIVIVMVQLGELKMKIDIIVRESDVMEFSKWMTGQNALNK